MKPNAGSTPLLPVSDPDNTSAWSSKRINPMTLVLSMSDSEWMPPIHWQQSACVSKGIW